MPSTPDRKDALPFGMKPSRYKWFVVGILWFICFFNYADRQAIISIKPLLGTEFNLSNQQLGWIVSAFMIVYAFSSPIAGQVGDRLPRKLVIMAGLYVWSAVTGFTALCYGFWGFVGVRAAEGLGETFYFPASMSLVSDYHGKRTRSRAMSIHQTSVYAGIIGGGSLAAWMAARYGWWTPFVFLGIGGILLGLVLGVFLREPKRNQADLEDSAALRASKREEAGEVAIVDASPAVAVAPIPVSVFLSEFFSTPSAVILLVAFTCVNFVAWVVITWMPDYLFTHFKLSLTQSGVNGTTWLQIGSLVGALLGGWLADKWRAKVPGGRMATQAAGLLMGAPFVFICGTTESLEVLIVTLTIFGVFKGIYESNIWASLYDVVPAARRGTAVGLMNMIGWLGGAVAPPAVGFAADREWFTFGEAIAGTGFIYLTLGVILMLSAIFLAPRDVRRVAAQQALLDG